MSFLGDVAFLRKHVGDKVTEDITDPTDYETALTEATSMLKGDTLKNDWVTSTTHPLYNSAKTVVHYYASFYLLSRFGGNQIQVNEHYTIWEKLSTRLINNLNRYNLANDTGEGSSKKYSVVKSKPKTYPKYTDANIHKTVTVH